MYVRATDPFTLTSAETDFEGLSPDVDKVTTLVLDETISPFEAWLQVLGIDIAKLPDLLDLPKNRCDYYLKKNREAPPPANILSFCQKLRLHPAYLQPTLREENFLYYSCANILKVIADVLSMPDATKEDKELSLNALKIERKKYEDFQHKNPEIAGLLKQANDHFLKNNKAEFLSLNPDVEVSLDHYRMFLARELAELQEKVLHRDCDSFLERIFNAKCNDLSQIIETRITHLPTNRLVIAMQSLNKDMKKFDDFMNDADVRGIAIPLFNNYCRACFHLQIYESQFSIPPGSIIDVHWGRSF